MKIKKKEEEEKKEKRKEKEAKNVTLNARLSKEDVAPILWHHPTQSVLTFEGLTVPLTCHPKEAPLVLMAVYYAFDIKVPEKASPALSFLFRLLGLRNPGNLSPKLQALYDELQE